MNLLDDPKLKVEKAVIDDMLAHEGWTALIHDGNGAIISGGGEFKCVFKDIATCSEYLKRYSVSGEVCILGLPLDAPRILGFDSRACKTYIYDRAMPPAIDGAFTVRRLAPSLAKTVRDAYCGDSPTGYSVSDMERLMREKGIFGAFCGSAFAGFIGRHSDGNMGMLHVFDEFRRGGVGIALEKFMINYVMTFGRVPICDVYTDNLPSIALQNKLGMTAASAYTFWTNVR